MCHMHKQKIARNQSVLQTYVDNSTRPSTQYQTMLNTPRTNYDLNQFYYEFKLMGL